MRDRYGLTRAESDFLKGTAIFAQCDFVFRAPVYIVENDSWQFAAGQSSEVIDIDNMRRCDFACVLHDLLVCMTSRLRNLSWPSGKMAR
jgi:hypothetical protein